MRIDLDALLAANDVPFTSAVSQSDLLELHRQLADRSAEQPKFVRAAQVVSDLSTVLHGFPTADPRTVSMVVTSLITALRRPAFDRVPLELSRYDVASTWIETLRIQRRAERPSVDADS